jgi:hypothetical protein
MDNEDMLLAASTIVTPPAGHTTTEAWEAWYEQLRVMGTAELDTFDRWGPALDKLA